MIEIKNLAAVVKQLDEWEASVYRLVQDVSRGLTVTLFKTALRYSPQYSGDFASNWRYSINEIDTSFETGNFVVLGYDNRPSRHQGDMEAINHALMYNIGNDRKFRLGDTVFITNSSAHDQAYSMMVWDDTIKRRRDANPDWVAERVLDLFSHYSVITPGMARRLTKENLLWT